MVLTFGSRRGVSALRYFLASDYGAIPDEFFVDGVAASASATFTSATANFTAADVGKTIVILRAGTSNFQDHHTTIASIDSPTQVQLTNTAGRSQSACRFYISRGGDQAAAIQAAINACTAAGGGRVMLPGVGYLVASSLTLKNRVWLQGAGRRATLLHLAGSSNCPVIVNDITADNTAMACGVLDMWVDGNRVRQTDTTSTLNGAYTPGNATITLIDASTFSYSGALLIGTNRLRYTSKSGNVLSGVLGGTEGTTDASGSNGATVTQHRCHGIYFTTNPYNASVNPVTAEFVDPHHLLQNLIVKNCKGDGVALWGQSETRVVNVHAVYADHFGFRPSYDTWLENCTADTNGRAGFYVYSSSITGVNNKAFYNGGNVAAEGHGFFFEGPSAVLEEGTKVFAGCSSQDNKAHGVYIRNAQRVMWQGTCSTNSTSSAGTYVGVCIDGATNGVIDAVCTDRTQGTATQQSAVQYLETGGVVNSNMAGRIAHAVTSGTSGISTMVKSGSVFTGGGNGIVPVSWPGSAPLASPAGAGTVTPDLLAGKALRIQMPAGNITIAAPLNPFTDYEWEVTVIQDGVGSRTVTWNGVFKFSGAVAPTLTLTASRRDNFRFRYDGTSWFEVSRDLNVG